MKTRRLALGLSALALAVTGCATGSGTSAVTPAGAASSMAAGQPAAGGSATPSPSMEPGHSAELGHSHTMASGQTMAGKSHAHSEPSAASKMVCTGRVPDTVQTVLNLDAPAPTSTSWQDQLYTCAYTLPMGKMVLSVKESASKPAARAYFEALRAKLGSTEPLLAVGEQAYATKTGTAVVLKDSMTLRVDTTDLPAVFGPQQQRRTDLAYEMATVVMGCWVDHQ